MTWTDMKEALSVCLVCFFPLYLAEVEQLRDAEVLVADPKVATPFLFNMPKLKWLQSTWAGEEHWRNA